MQIFIYKTFHIHHILDSKIYFLFYYLEKTNSNFLHFYIFKIY